MAGDHGEKGVSLQAGWEQPEGTGCLGEDEQDATFKVLPKAGLPCRF